MKTKKLDTQYVLRLRKHMIYLNNLIRDKYFIYMVYRDNTVQYYYNFPSDTYNVKLLEEYINKTEYMFYRYGVVFKSFN
jgi:hypothetical protein